MNRWDERRLAVLNDMERKRDLEARLALLTDAERTELERQIRGRKRRGLWLFVLAIVFPVAWFAVLLWQRTGGVIPPT